MRAAYSCIQGQMASVYRASGHVLVRDFNTWTRITGTPFSSDAIGGRYGVVYANGRTLGHDLPVNHFDRGFAVGSTLAVSTFTITEDGTVEGGPLIFVEKMEPGFFALQGNWRYTIVGTDGRVEAATRGANEESVSICVGCTHSQSDLLYATLLNDGIAPFAAGDGPAFPSLDTYGSSGGLVSPETTDEAAGDDAPSGEVRFLDPNAPVFDPNAPLDPNAPILDPNAPITDG